MKKVVFSIILFSLFQFQCKEETTGPVQESKEEVLIGNEDSSIVFIVDKNNLTSEANNYRIESVYTKSGVLINIYSPTGLSGDLSYIVSYETKVDSISSVKSATVYKYENNEFIETGINTIINESQKQISFTINSFSKLFVPYSPDFYPNNDCNCSTLSGYIKYITFNKLKSDIDALQKSSVSGNSIPQCSAIRMLYIECMAGVYYFEDKKYEDKLFFDWLFGTGILDEPVIVQNSLFDDKKSAVPWTDIWRGIAKNRANEYYDCSLLNKGLSGSIEEKFSGFSESSAAGIGEYDFYTRGSYNVSLSNSAAKFSFNITVRPQDKVDFNSGCAFGGVFTICGEPFEILIPDKWRSYLRQCPRPLSGNDYIIQGSETSFTFNSSDFPDKNCGYLNDCISVVQGEWEFNIVYNDETVATFVGGILYQKDCSLSYGTEKVFDGPLVGTYWSGTNTKMGFSFEGTFNAKSANKFTGTLTTFNPVNVYSMTGSYANTISKINGDTVNNAPASTYSNRKFDLFKK